MLGLRTHPLYESPTTEVGCSAFLFSKANVMFYIEQLAPYDRVKNKQGNNKKQ
jgi:hypothetical protein